MKRIGIVIAALAALVVGAMPMAASAAAAKPAAITQKQRDDAKPLIAGAIAQAKLTCTPTDSYLYQSGQDPKTKAKINVLEVSCSEGPGFMIQQVGDTAQAIPCLKQEEDFAKDPKSVKCQLEANADAKAGFSKLLTGMGHPCTATGARIIGATAAGDMYYELACGGADGYVVQTSPGKAALASPCIQMLGGNTECTLTTKAAILEGMTKLAQPSGKNCTVSDARLVGTGAGSTYYEVACGSTPGFMIQANATGAFQQAIECRAAQNLGGGCSLTVVDETAEAGTYTKLAQGAAFPCDVSKYRYLGKEPKSNSEIVELACKNRPDGGVGVFPISGGKAQVFDCVQGGSLGVTCQLSQPNVVYAKYTDRLAAQGKTQCKVSGAKFLASTEQGSDYIETACSDGLPGFVISIDHASGKTNELLTCGQVSRSGAPCTLPTNVAAK